MAVPRLPEQQRALSQVLLSRCNADGYFFTSEIVPITLTQKKGNPLVFDKVEHPRETSLESLAKLKGVAKEDGTVTAGNASGVNDGACALLLASETAIKQHGLTPKARVLAMATAGVPPRIMGFGPAPAMRKVLEKTGLKLAQMDVIELNEAFAAGQVYLLATGRLRPARLCKTPC